MNRAQRNGAGVPLSQLLRGLESIEPAQDYPVTSLSLDSRLLQPGGLFLACQGSAQRHGLDFLPQALAAGAGTVLWEPGAEWNRERVGQLAARQRNALIRVDGLGAQLSRIAGRFYGHPSRDLDVIGVTGTNGKTSCTQFLAQALAVDVDCGVVGTLGTGFPGDLVPGQHTTPDAVSLQAALADLRARGARAVAMEVSSHALDQGRVAAVRFQGAVLTNLSRDHLDYHGDMQRYAAAKRRLFDLPELAFAVLNLDDAFGRQLAEELVGRHACVGYGQGEELVTARVQIPLLRANGVRSGPDGMTIELSGPWGDGQLASALLGRFNVSNLLAVLAVLLQRGVPLAEGLRRLSRLDGVPGRMERFGGGDRPLVVVDYAHTPDALEHALSALRPHVLGDLVCVVGCGGDRDKGKRPQMGRVAEALAQRTIVTDDNPRSEDGDQIVAEILAGMRQPQQASVIRDRAAAIRSAVDSASSGDIVLVAGKGHETSQQIGALKVPFSDRDQVARALAGNGTGETR